MINLILQQIQKFTNLKKSLNLSFLLIFSLLVIFNIQLKAQGNLVVNPKRVVFDGQKRIIEISLSNSGQDSARYNISFLQVRMTEDGAFQMINEPDQGQKFADKNIRFYPRSVMLGPNESQIVKLQLLKSDLLEPGEYRSHLYFRSMNSKKALGEEDAKKDTTVFSLKIIPTFGITIPVIIRIGEPTTILTISDIKLVKGVDVTSKLNLILNRIGNMSAYGDLSVLHISPNGKETKIGLAQGIAIYTPNQKRKITIDIENKSSIDLSKGIIRVLFSSQSETRPQKLAEKEIVL